MNTPPTTQTVTPIGSLGQRLKERMRRLPRRWKWLSATLMLAVLASVAGFNPYWHPFYFGSKTMQAPTEYQWHCLGRYQIMLPKGMVALTEGKGLWYAMFTLYYGLDADHKQIQGQVKNKDHTPDQFDRAYRAHRDELARTINSDTKKPMLLQEERIGERAYLVRRMERHNSHIGVMTELHQWVGSRYVILKADSFPKDSEIDPYITTVDFTTEENRLKSISPKLFAITQATASRKGFCFGGVVFDVGQDTERTGFDFYMPNQPMKLEVSYTGSMDPGTREPFSKRIARLPTHTQLTIQTLRDRTTQVGPGLPWHELLIRLPGWDVPEDLKPEPMHLLMGQHAYNQGTTLDKPAFELQLVLGEGGRPPVASPFSDADALAIWDRIVGSIRQR